MSKYIKALILLVLSIICIIAARQLFLLFPVYENLINETACLFIGFFILAISSVVSIIVALVYILGGFDNK